MLGYLACQLRRCHQLRKLDQRQRVAARSPDQLCKPRRAEVTHAATRQQVPGSRWIKPSKPHAGDPRKPGGAPIGVTRRDEQYDTLGIETPRHKIKRIYRGTVQPMRIINHRQQRRLLSGTRKQPQHRGTDSESVADRQRTLLQRQRNP
jgi:hypothetical protein